MPGGAAVVPGAHVFVLQKHSADIFSQENTGHVNEAPLNERNISHFLHDGSEESSASIGREHPERGISDQLKIAYAKSVKTGPENFQSPAGYATPKKVLSYHTE